MILLLAGASGCFHQRDPVELDARVFFLAAGLFKNTSRAQEFEKKGDHMFEVYRDRSWISKVHDGVLLGK